MIGRLIILLNLLVFSLCSAPDQRDSSFGFASLKGTNSNKMNYRYYLPNTSHSDRIPLILFLHGANGRGEDNIKHLDYAATFWASPEVQNKYPAYILAPQCPPNRQFVNTSFKTTPFDHYVQDSIPESDELIMVLDLVNEFCHTYSIDTSRIYIVGFSMGASGTWDLITRHSGVFSAAIIMAGVSDTSKAETITHIPIWAFNGENDAIAPAKLNKEMVKTINEMGGNAQHTVFIGIGHDCIRQTYQTSGLIDWLFSQHLKTSD